MSMLDQKRKEAQSIYESLPMPKEREERWRHTPIDRFVISDFLPLEAPSLFLSEVSEEMKNKGVIFCRLSYAAAHHSDLFEKHYQKNANPSDKFLSFNSSHWIDGAFLYVPKGVKISEPISSHFSLKENSAIRNLLILEEDAEAIYSEQYDYLNESNLMGSVVSEVFGKEDSKLSFCHLTHSKENTFSFNHLIADVSRGACMNWYFGGFGGKLNRIHIDTHFREEGAHSENVGIFLGNHKQHIDVTTNAFHHAPNTKNDMFIEGIMKGRSTSIYRGLIKIEKDAQLTSSFLSNHILKLSETSLANSIPALEIDANDVKASHGATVGQIDEEQLFYLMSRGLSRIEAENAITEGFFEPLIGKMPTEEFKERIRSSIREASL